MSRGFKPKEQQKLSIEESKPEERPTMPRRRNKVKTGVNPAISHVWVSGNLKLQWGKESPSITTLPESLPLGKPRTETRRSWGLVPSNLSCPLRHQSQACPLKCWHNSHLVLLVFISSSKMMFHYLLWESSWHQHLPSAALCEFQPEIDKWLVERVLTELKPGQSFSVSNLVPDGPRSKCLSGTCTGCKSKV